MQGALDPEPCRAGLRGQQGGDFPPTGRWKSQLSRLLTRTRSSRRAGGERSLACSALLAEPGGARNAPSANARAGL